MMSRESLQALLARAEREPAFRPILETNGYVALASYTLTVEEADAAQRWDLPTLWRLADETESSTGAGA